MIKTARQLKDKVKNLVGDTNLNNKAQTMRLLLRRSCIPTS